ncbi:hypothetical protein AAG570_007405 [Ranatra chinensis]|uniref:Uncharacterized protein n=1 Tax=Ranatra chinensis TaxID=642074 RepID=A0ABD0XYG0_9HEMI
MGSVEKTREWSTHGQQGGVSADAIASHMVTTARAPIDRAHTTEIKRELGLMKREATERAFEGKLCRSVTRVLVGARPNVGQMEVPGSNVKGTAPKAQTTSSRRDGTSSASPQPKKSGQKVCSQQASQRKSDELRPKNRKDFTFGDRKAEEIRIRNKELRERLNRIKQRKPPSYKQCGKMQPLLHAPLQLCVLGINQPRRAFHWCGRQPLFLASPGYSPEGTQLGRDGLPMDAINLGKMCRGLSERQESNQVEIADFPPDDDTNGVEVDQISPTADGGCPLSRTEEDSIGGSRSLRDEKEHEGEADTRPEHEGTSSSNPKVDGTNLHTPPASQHGEKMELPNGNKNNSSTRTLDELFAKVNDVEVEIIPAALPPNGVSTGVDFNKIAPAVNSVCPQCRTIEQNMFSEGRSLGKEKEHEGEATRANSSPEYQGKTLPKPSYYQIDGSSSAPPHHTGIGPNTYASPAPQCRKEEELPISENSILSYIVSAVDEFDSKYKYWSDQVREGKTLSNTQTTVLLRCNREPPAPDMPLSLYLVRPHCTPAEEGEMMVILLYLGYPSQQAKLLRCPEPMEGTLYRADIRDTEMPYRMAGESQNWYISWGFITAIPSAATLQTPFP